MVLIGIIIQIIILFMSAAVVALPLAGIVLWRSKKDTKRNTVLAFLSPFVFIYTSYFGCLVGGFSCSTIFDTGCGMDGYYHTNLPNGYEIESVADDFDREYFTGNISKDGKTVIKWVTKIKVIGDTIYGERYFVSEVPGSEYYFSLDTKTDKLTQYTSCDEAKQSNPITTTALTHLECFYYQSWQWVIPLGILVFVIASGVVFIMWFTVKRVSYYTKR